MESILAETTGAGGSLTSILIIAVIILLSIGVIYWLAGGFR